jgi:hypothetical protein
MTPGWALNAACAITSVGVIIGSGEWYWISVRTSGRATVSLFAARRGLALFLSRSVLVGRIAAGAATVAGCFHAALLTPAMVLVILFSLLAYLLNPLGLEAADFIALGTFSVAAAARLQPEYLGADRACLLVFVMAALSYLAAGVCKFFSDVWGSGKALPGVLSTVSFGNPVLAERIRGKRLTPFLEWSVILAELSFPTILLAPGRIALVLLSGMAVFHLVIAVAMGLNLFFWAYVGTFPCVYYVTLVYL